MKQRPGGITILAIIYILLAVLSILWALLIMGVGGMAGFTGMLFGAEGMASAGGNWFWGAMLAFGLAILQLVVAFGLLGLKRWAWLLALVAVGLTFVQGIIGLFGGGLGAFLCGAIGLVIPAGILFYLLRPHVRAAFQA
jgi:hypothetical protein